MTTLSPRPVNVDGCKSPNLIKANSKCVHVFVVQKLVTTLPKQLKFSNNKPRRDFDQENVNPSPSVATPTTGSTINADELQHFIGNEP